MIISVISYIQQREVKDMFSLISLTSIATWKAIALVCSASGAILQLGSSVSEYLRDDDE